MRFAVDGRAWLRIFAATELILVGAPTLVYAIALAAASATPGEGPGVLATPPFLVLCFLSDLYLSLPRLFSPAIHGISGWAVAGVLYSVLALVGAMAMSLYVPGRRDK